MIAYTNSQRIMQGIHTNNAKDHQQRPPSQPPHEHPNYKKKEMERKNRIRTKTAGCTTSKPKLNEILTDEAKTTMKKTPPPAAPPPPHSRRTGTNVYETRSRTQVNTRRAMQKKHN